MKNSKTKKLNLKKLKIAKLDNTHLVRGGSIIVIGPPPVETDEERNCQGHTHYTCLSKIRCVFVGR